MELFPGNKEFCPVKVRHLLIILRCSLDSFADGGHQLLGRKDLFEEGELEKKVVASKMEITATDDKTYETSYYSLDAIIASNLLL